MLDSLDIPDVSLDILAFHERPGGRDAALWKGEAGSAPDRLVNYVINRVADTRQATREGRPKYPRGQRAPHAAEPQSLEVRLKLKESCYF